MNRTRDLRSPMILTLPGTLIWCDGKELNCLKNASLPLDSTASSGDALFIGNPMVRQSGCSNIRYINQSTFHVATCRSAALPESSKLCHYLSYDFTFQSSPSFSFYFGRHVTKETGWCLLFWKTTFDSPWEVSLNYQFPCECIKGRGKPTWMVDCLLSPNSCRSRLFVVLVG